MSAVIGSFTKIDWSRLPVPEDDGAARHLLQLASVAVALIRWRRRRSLRAWRPHGGVHLSDDRHAGDCLARRLGRDTGRTGLHAASMRLPRPIMRISRRAGAGRRVRPVDADVPSSRRRVERLHLPFSLLSDAALRLARAMALPTMLVAGETMFKRMTLIIDDGVDHACVLPGVSARPERGRSARLAEGEPGDDGRLASRRCSDDGAARHLVAGVALPDHRAGLQPRGDGQSEHARGRRVVYVYPWTGRPGVADPPGWDDIAGAHGSTPETEGFRDHYLRFRAQRIEVFGPQHADDRAPAELIDAARRAVSAAERRAVRFQGGAGGCRRSRPAGRRTSSA